MLRLLRFKWASSKIILCFCSCMVIYCLAELTSIPHQYGSVPVYSKLQQPWLIDRRASQRFCIGFWDYRVGKQRIHAFCVCELVWLMNSLISDKIGRQENGWNLIHSMCSLSLFLNQTEYYFNLYISNWGL